MERRESITIGQEREHEKLKNTKQGKQKTARGTDVALDFHLLKQIKLLYFVLSLEAENQLILQFKFVCFANSLLVLVFFMFLSTL